jgi:hypothetical protein
MDLARTEEFLSSFQGLARGVETLFDGGLIDVDENSDFGQAVEQMRTGHLAAVNRRTTVVVLGDGRNNGRPPDVAALEENRPPRPPRAVDDARAALGLAAGELRHSPLRAGVRRRRGRPHRRRPRHLRRASARGRLHPTANDVAAGFGSSRTMTMSATG